MTDEQRKRIHDITYSTEDREELAERIVALEDERDKLRRERDLYSSLVEEMDHPDTANQLREENAKLREYAESYAKAVECEGCGWCPYDMDTVCDTETIPMRDGCRLYDELRELRIEVDG